MKICGKCGFENPDTYTTCAKCYSMLEEKSSEITTEAFFKKLDKKDKIKNIIHYVIMAIYLIIVIPFFVLCVKTEDDASLAFFLLFILSVCLITYYLSVFHPDAMFKISHISVISNIDDVQPSDWYYMTSTFGGYVCLAIGIFTVIRLYTILC